MPFTYDDFAEGDYVKLSQCDGLFKIEGVGSDYIDLVDDWGMHTDAPFDDVTDIFLESEIENPW